jgi:hypothetical protein
MKTSTNNEEANIQTSPLQSTQEKVSKSKSDVKANESSATGKAKKPNYLRRLL